MSTFYPEQITAQQYKASRESAMIHNLRHEKKNVGLFKYCSHLGADKKIILNPSA